MQQTQGDRRVAGMIDASLPFDQNHVRVLGSLQYQPLGRAGDEVGDHGIHRDAPALDHDAGLAGGHKPGAKARRR